MGEAGIVGCLPLVPTEHGLFSLGVHVFSIILARAHPWTGTSVQNHPPPRVPVPIRTRDGVHKEFLLNKGHE